MVHHNTFLVIAVTKHTFEQLDTQNSEHKQEQKHNKQDVQERWNRLDQRIDHSFDSFILTDNSQWPQSSQCSETSYKLDIVWTQSRLEDPRKDRETYNNEIKNVPRIFQVCLVTPVETLNEDFDDCLNDEDDGDNQKHQTDRRFLIFICKLRLIQC